LFEEIYATVREKFSTSEGSHDWQHIERVIQNARIIQKKEGGDILVVELGALLHDIADHKFHENDFDLGPKVAREIVLTHFRDDKLANKIAEIVNAVSFKGALVEDIPVSIEGKIVRDADRLDAIGAVGIARAFAYGGSQNRPLFNTQLPPILHNSKESYAKSKSHTINHFFEKLLLLRERMETATARELAKERHLFMISYLQQFFNESGFLNEGSEFDLSNFRESI
jgi:uncharacterized protein